MEIRLKPNSADCVSESETGDPLFSLWELSDNCEILAYFENLESRLHSIFLNLREAIPYPKIDDREEAFVETEVSSLKL